MLIPAAELLPHAGRMRLIDRVVSYDSERIICESDSHHAANHPLAQDGALPAVCALEYGAQAMAVHGALLAASKSPSSHGYLVAASDLRWSIERLDQCKGPLSIEAICELRSDRQVAYRFQVRAAGETVLSGRASVLLGMGEQEAVPRTDR